MPETQAQETAVRCPLCHREFKNEQARGQHFSKTHMEVDQREILKQEIEALADELGEPPTASEFGELSGYSYGACSRVFGSWSEALRAAGYEPGYVRDIPESELLDEIHRIADIVGRTPTEGDVAEHGKYSRRPFRDRFGGWTAAVQAAGYEPNNIRNIPDDNLLEEIRRLADELGRPPMMQDMEEQGAYSQQPFYRAFGTWNNALEAAGYEPYRANIGEGERWSRYMRGFTDTVKQQVRDRDGNQCVDCGLTSEEHRDEHETDLHVHHVCPSGSTNPAVFNAPRNLVTVCLPCHKNRHSERGDYE